MKTKKGINILGFILFISIFLLGIGWQSHTSLAASAKKITVSTKDIESMGARNAIQEVLYEARDLATESQPYVVTVPAGSYEVDNSLRLYSNTTLILKGVTIKRVDTNNIIKVGDTDTKETGKTGYYYKNITVQGGTLNGNGVSGTVMKVTHTKNFTMSGVTLKNVHNGHIMETGGVNGLNVLNCTFKDQTLSTNKTSSTYEALQLDILCSSHLNACRSEDLGTKNVKIDHCTFKNVPRGVGSHTAILNNPMKSIQITNCTFSNMKSSAIQVLNWRDCKIANNTITGTPRGIAVYSMSEGGRGVFLSTVLANEGNTKAKSSTKYQKPKNEKIVINNNKITLNNSTDPYASYERVAIMVFGDNIQSSKKYSDNSGNLPKGNYYANGITIRNNTITTTGHGIRFVNVKNSKVEKNTITFKKVKDSLNYYGVQMKEGSTGNTVSGNTINNPNCNGIYLSVKSSAKSIDSNVIKNAGKYGIDVEDSKAESITSNKITSSKNVGIFIFNKGSAGTISKNCVKSASSYGIAVNTNAKASAITGNTISNTKDVGIAIGASTVTSIKNNTITTTKNAGISVYKKSKVTTVSSNSITNPGTYGIRFVVGATGSTVTKNTILKAKTAALNISSDSKVKKVTENYLLEKPVLSSVVNTKGKKVTVKWNKNPSAKGYQISYKTGSTSKTVTVKNENTVKTVLSGLKKGKTYKISVRSYSVISKEKCYSAWSSAKSVKIVK